MKYVIVAFFVFFIYVLSPYSAQKFIVGDYYIRSVDYKDPHLKDTNDTIKIVSYKDGYYRYTYLINKSIFEGTIKKQNGLFQDAEYQHINKKNIYKKF